MIFKRNKSFAFFFMHSIWLPIESLSAMCLSSLLISEMLSSDLCSYVFVMLSCKSLLYVPSEVSYMFLDFFHLLERNELSTTCASVRFPLFRLNSSNSCPLMV